MTHTPASGPAPVTYFDTDLLGQIIEVEVDNAVRQLEASGKVITDTLSRSWYTQLTESIFHIVGEEAKASRILPHDFQDILKTMLWNLIDVDTDNIKEKAHTRHRPRPFQRLWRVFTKKVPS